MITDEQIVDNLDRVNKLIEYSIEMGDSAPVIGTIIILAMTDEEFENFMNPGFTSDVLETVIVRLAALGVKA